MEYQKKGTTKDTVFIAVYGTLKRCESANYMLEYFNDGYHGKHVLKNHKLFTMSERASFPYIIPAEGYHTQCEVYRIPKRVLPKIDTYEGYTGALNSHYFRKTVTFEDFPEECYIYYVDSDRGAVVEAKKDCICKWTSENQIEEVPHAYDSKL